MSGKKVVFGKKGHQERRDHLGCTLARVWGSGRGCFNGLFSWEFRERSFFNISNKWHISHFFYFSRVATCGPPKLCVCFTERKSPVGTSHLQSEVCNFSLQSESLRRHSCGAGELGTQLTGMSRFFFSFVFFILSSNSPSQEIIVLLHLLAGKFRVKPFSLILFSWGNAGVSLLQVAVLGVHYPVGCEIRLKICLLKFWRNLLYSDSFTGFCLFV